MTAWEVAWTAVKWILACLGPVAVAVLYNTSYWPF